MSKNTPLRSELVEIIGYAEMSKDGFTDAADKILSLIASHTAKEVELIIEMRSQGIWYDLTDKKNDKMNKTTLTGCSVVPTRELIKLWEKLTGKKHKAWEATDVQLSSGVRIKT